METEMPNSLKSEDPTVAVLIDRLSSLTDEIKEMRAERKDELVDLRCELKADIAAVKADQLKVNDIISKARGGYLVLVGLGGFLLWLLGFWDKILKLWATI